MIDIIDKKNCVGCNGCVQVCPVSCISMHTDEQGFLYPKVDTERCIHCNRCDRVCPVINQSEPKIPEDIYGATNPNKEELMTSSSGGIFILLAKKIISEGGVVFGARFNEKWEVIHDYSETLEGIKAFQGSKYVQSEIGDCYKKTEQFLKEGRKVLFSGTPCQIAGLNLFLKKDYGDLLLKVDVICHGVPSPLVWQEYLKTIPRPKGAVFGKNTDFQLSLKDKPKILDISFRDKRISWEKFGFSVRYAATEGSGKNSDFQSLNGKKEKREETFFEIHRKNLFMECFLKDLCLRPSCYSCPAKSGKSNSDITLADFWHCQELLPEGYNENGVSLIIIQTQKGKESISELKFPLMSAHIDLNFANHSYLESAILPKEYNTFWKVFNEGNYKKIRRILKSLNISFYKRIRRKLKRIFKISR